MRDPHQLYSTNSRAMDFLTGLCRTTTAACRVDAGGLFAAGQPNVSGGPLYLPAARSGYPAFWIRDFAMAVDGAGIPTPDLAHAVRWTARHQAEAAADTPRGGHIPAGSIPDHINADGTPIYFPGTYDAHEQGPPWRELPAFDGAYFFVEMLWAWFRREGAGVLREEVHGRSLLERAGFAFLMPPVADDGSGLVVCRDGGRGVGFGFMDSVVLTGQVLFPSLLRQRAARRLADLLRAVHAEDKARDYADQADRVQANLASFIHPESGLLKAASGIGGQPDVWGSAFAVSEHLADAALRERLARALLALYRRGSLVWRGAVRHVPVGFDASATSAWERMVAPGFGERNRYQNGAYWFTPLGWLYEALHAVDPGAARELACDYLRTLEEDGAGGGDTSGLYECMHPEGDYRKLPWYLTSIACPLASFRRIPPAW